jgi:hypothetical protein
VRKLFAIFFSLALMASQIAFVDAVGEVAAAPKCCGHCGGCKGASCCLVKQGSGSHQSSAAIPSHASSRADLQLFAVALVRLLPSSPVKSATPPLNFLAPRASAAPLYQRTCSYLI